MVAAVLGRRRDDPLTGETLQVVTRGGLWVVHLLPGDDRRAVARAWRDPGPESRLIRCDPAAPPPLFVARPVCCGHLCGLYVCPASRQVECPHHGGFDVCCSRPWQHVPVGRFPELGLRGR
jgi:hypothetical protein